MFIIQNGFTKIIIKRIIEKVSGVFFRVSNWHLSSNPELRESSSRSSSGLPENKRANYLEFRMNLLDLLSMRSKTKVFFIAFFLKVDC